VRERNHLEDPGVDGKIILRWTFMKWDGGAWNGWIWLRIGTGDGNFGLDKMWGLSLLAENRLASQGLCSMGQVIKFSF
jgi:hypothetical protein